MVATFGYTQRQGYEITDSELKVLVQDIDIVDKNNNYISTLRYDYRGIDSNNLTPKVSEFIKKSSATDSNIEYETKSEEHYSNNPINN